MAIRSGAKAIIIKDKSILLNQCHHSDGRTYYDLPGGGQNQYESLEQAVVREVLEETGLTVRVKRFVALAEEIYQIIYLKPNSIRPIYSIRKQIAKLVSFCRNIKCKSIKLQPLSTKYLK